MIEKLYEYQKEAVSAALAVDVGTVVLPTGTGKTFCQSAIIASDIQAKEDPSIYVVNCPRILLSFQLLKEVYRFLTASGFDARYMFVHSGGATDVAEMEKIRLEANKLGGSNVKFAQIESSTSSSEIADAMEGAKVQGLPLILFSTYHSCPRIESARIKAGTSIRMMMNDEAHYLTQEEFHKILSEVASERRYFFTATARYTASDEGRGMNNESKFGSIVYSMTPREAIELGKMVRPRIHTFLSPDVNSFDDFQKSMSKIIFNAFTHHDRVLVEDDSDLSAKILVAAKGVGDIKKFLESKEYAKLRKQDVTIFAVASNEDVGNRINSQTVNRKEFLRRLKAAGEDPTKRLIVLHYDILAEGIDVSGFTGILPLRSLCKSKFLQTYGRAARLHPEDRKAFETGAYKPSDADKLRKPYAYILAPNVAKGNEDDYHSIVELIYNMREFDFSCVENVLTSEIVNGIPESEVVDGTNDVENKLKEIGKIIEKIESDLEIAELASLSKKGKMKRHLLGLRHKKAIKAGKKRNITGYNVFESMEAAREEGATTCNRVSRNNAKDLAAFITRKATISKTINVLHVDGSSPCHPKSWVDLEKNHPEYIGKFIVPIFEYV